MKLRSFLFVPANKKDYIEKALNSNADAIILDLEDSVPKDQRSKARLNIKEYSENHYLDKKTVFVRINCLNEDDFLEDIQEVVINGIDGIMPSKVQTDIDIIVIDKLLTIFETKNNVTKYSIRLAPLIETAKALENLSKIAQSSNRLIALCLGAEDYLNDIRSIFTYQESALIYPRAKLVNIARGNGLLPIDTPYINYSDISGFIESANTSYRNGFAGTLITTPRQIDTANKAYSPTEEQFKNAQMLLKSFQAEEQKSIISIDGKLFGPPMRKKAENILESLGISIGR